MTVPNPEDFADGPILTPPGDMSPAERAGWERLIAGFREYEVQRERLILQCSETAKAMQNFAAAFIIADWHIAETEADEIAAHPDLAELNVALDGFYGL